MVTNQEDVDLLPRDEKGEIQPLSNLDQSWKDDQDMSHQSLNSLPWKQPKYMQLLPASGKGVEGLKP